MESVESNCERNGECTVAVSVSSSNVQEHFQFHWQLFTVSYNNICLFGSYQFSLFLFKLGFLGGCQFSLLVLVMFR